MFTIKNKLVLLFSNLFSLKRTDSIAILVHVELGISFHYDLISETGKSIRSFSPDWSFSDIEHWAGKKGYSVVDHRK